MPEAIRCTTCRRRYRATSPTAGGWNVTMRKGVVLGYLCPLCQTPEDNAEAEANAAMLDYYLDDDGRYRARPKAES